jgi:ribosome-binding protein aMBF1 (putative translation factor)
MVKAVGLLIKDQREKRGMTKTSLAKQLGCSPQNIDSLESRKSIDFELGQRISVVLEFDLFDYYRVFRDDESAIGEEYKRELVIITNKYMKLLEKHNRLLEESIATSAVHPIISSD